MKHQSGESLPSRAVWWPISHVAPSLGLSVDLMLSAIAAGQLPIRAEAFGARGLVHVNSGDTLAYIKSQNTPPFRGASDDEMDEGGPVDATGFWRLAAVASLLNADPLTLRADAEAGRVPLRLAYLGASERPYVRCDDVLAYLATQVETAP